MTTNDGIDYAAHERCAQVILTLQLRISALEDEGPFEYAQRAKDGGYVTSASATRGEPAEFGFEMVRRRSAGPWEHA